MCWAQALSLVFEWVHVRCEPAQIAQREPGLERVLLVRKSDSWILPVVKRYIFNISASINAVNAPDIGMVASHDSTIRVTLPQ